MLNFLEERWNIDFNEQGFDIEKTLGLQFIEEELEGRNEDE